MANGRSRSRSRQIGVAAVILAILSAFAVVLYRQVYRPQASLRSASLAVADLLQKQRRPADATAVRHVCAAFWRSACKCVQTGVPLALDQELGPEALSVLDKATSSCPVTPTLRALKAEALARANQPMQALAEAAAVLNESSRDPHAQYAVAHVHYLMGQWMPARQAAANAVQFGRGPCAHLLLGLIAYRVNDMFGAKAEFDQVLHVEPNNIAALYNLALVYQRMNLYHDSRELYLKVLHIDPTQLDARYNLAVLAHSIGADEEAKHHLEKLFAVDPSNERVARLKAIIDAPPKANAMPAGTPGSSAGN